MVSDSELVERLREMLRDADVNTTSTSSLRRSLEEEFGVDLSDRKAFVRQQVNIFFSEFDVPQQEEDPDEVEPQEMEHEVAGGEGIGGENGKAGEEEAEEENGHSSGSRKKKLRISLTLEEFVELIRTEFVKWLWTYIRENNLQDPNNKGNILCDERLNEIFNVNSITMFEMNKALTNHIWPLNSDGPVSPKRSTPKAKRQKRDKNEGKKKKGRTSRSGSGLLARVQISEDLAKFIGTDENMMSRSKVLKRMWEYIKENNLQVPSDRRKIICDEKLKDLLQIESFAGISLSRLLGPHFNKAK